MRQDTLFYRKSTLRIGDKIHSLASPLVMGILNVTPDSFSDGGLYDTTEKALEQAGRMIRDGADIIDVGGYSTRPGATDIDAGEENDRVLPVIEAIRHQFPDTLISIDTFRAGVARDAVSAGACMVNDISGGLLDQEMFETVGKLGVPYVLMHMKGTPQTMKNETEYGDLLPEMMKYFHERIGKARMAGIKEIIIDPGFGFAKTIGQNYYILENLPYFHSLNLPLLIGLSRKSMIYNRLKIDASDAVNGTTVLNTLALTSGVNILRVHDIPQAKEAIVLVKQLNHF